MKTTLSIIILGAVAWFAIGNASAVTLKLFLWEYSVSLALIVGVCFLLGFILGMIRLIPGLWSRSTSIKSVATKLAEVERERDELLKANDTLEEKIKNNETSAKIVSGLNTNLGAE